MNGKIKKSCTFIFMFHLNPSIMKKLHLSFIFTGFFIILCNQLQAQISEYKLSDYKLPDFKRHMLDFNFGLSSFHRIMDIELINDRELNYGGGFNSQYSFLKNSRKYQGRFTFYENLGLSSSRFKRDTVYKSTNKNFRSSNYLVINNQFFNQSEYFIQADLSSGFEYYRTNRVTEMYENNNWQNKTNEKPRTTYFDFNGTLGVGKGRIEPVQDARHALYILDALKKAGRLKREPSKEEITEIASKISILKNERVLDARLKKIEELNTIDSLLNQMGLIETPDMIYFSHLNDMWDYGGNQYRSSGISISVNYKPTFEYEKRYFYYDSIENKTEKEAVYHNYGLTMQWSKPIRQKFQSDMSFSGYGFYRKYNNEDTDLSLKGLQGSFKYQFIYYPDTRTSMFMGLIVSGEKLWDNEDAEFIEYNGLFDWGDRIHFNPYFLLDYYISPNLRLSISYSTVANKVFKNLEGLSHQKYIQSSIQAGIKYSIF